MNMGINTHKEPNIWSAEAFGEGDYEVVPPEREEEYRRQAEEENRRRRPRMYVNNGNTEERAGMDGRLR